MTSQSDGLSIVVAYDSGDASRAAVTAAARLARDTSAELAIVHVINPLTDLGGISAASTEEALRIKSSEREAEITTLVSSQEMTATVLVEPLKRGEDVAAHIAGMARSRSANLVVVASRRAQGLSGFILGSVAQELLKISPCPVVIVRPD